VVWRDAAGDLWEVTPQSANGGDNGLCFEATEFAIDPAAAFEFAPDGSWRRGPSRYVALRPQGKPVVELLTQAQLVAGNDQKRCLEMALVALQVAGFQPREWRLGSMGKHGRNIWLIVE
jgi:hypothetical protein